MDIQATRRKDSSPLREYSHPSIQVIPPSVQLCSDFSLLSLTDLSDVYCPRHSYLRCIPPHLTTLHIISPPLLYPHHTALSSPQLTTPHLTPLPSPHTGKVSPVDGLSEAGERPASRPKGRIELKNVFFKYPTRPEVEVCKVRYSTDDYSMVQYL